MSRTHILQANWSLVDLTVYKEDYTGYTLEVYLIQRGKSFPQEESQVFHLHPRMTNFTLPAENAATYEVRLAVRNEHGNGPFKTVMASEYLLFSLF